MYCNTRQENKFLSKQITKSVSEHVNYKFFTSAMHLMHLINIHGTTLQDVHMHLGWGDFVD